MRRIKTRTAIVLALIAGAAAPMLANTPMTDAEKMKVRELIKIMWKMQREDAPNATLPDIFNPTGQGGMQTGYDDIDRRPPFGRGPARMTKALRHYLNMLRTNKLCKDNSLSGGGYTIPKPGLNNDEVGISGQLLATWCDMTADPVQRARAKFWIGATLANEITHVFQTAAPAGATAMDKDKIGCDQERDSDCATIKYLEMLMMRLTRADGTPHTSLAGIEGEGRAGECIAKCLMDLGVDTEAEIAAFVAEMQALLDHYRDRKMNLFENQINQSKSWRSLYYDRKYKSPLRAKVNTTDMVTMRKITITYGPNSIMIMIPEDGKIPVGYIVTVDSESRLVIIVITLNPLTGEVCFHTWTDMNANGTPETGPASVAIPAPIIPRDLPDPADALFFHHPLPLLGQQDTIWFHDQLRGSLIAFEVDSNAIATGGMLEILDNPIIANPDAGNPSAGGFWSLCQIHEFPSSGRFQFVFSPETNGNAGGGSSAVIGEYDSLGHSHTFLPPLTLAQALAPGNRLGISEMPPPPLGPILMSNPGDFVQLLSVGRGSPLPIFLAPIDLSGEATVPPVILPPNPDLFRIQSLNTGEQTMVSLASAGYGIDTVDVNFTVDSFFDIFTLSSFPSRLSLFAGNPSGAFDCLGEVVCEDPDAGAINVTDPLVGPISIEGGMGEIPLTIIHELNLVGQTLIDADGDGEAADFFIIAKPCQLQQYQLLTVLRAGQPSMQVIPSPPLPPSFIPAGIEYVNSNGDPIVDLVIGNALGGPAQCRIGTPSGQFVPGPCPPQCPADLSGSADPNDPAYGMPDGIVDSSDFFYYLDQYSASNFGVADLTGSSDPNDPAYGVPDGLIDASDFFYYLDQFVLGCF